MKAGDSRRGALDPRRLSHGLFILLAAFVISGYLVACGGSTKETSYKTPSMPPPPKAITASDTVWVTKDWEFNASTAVKCKFISSNPVQVAASASTYKVVDSAGLLNNPAEIRPGQILEFGCAGTAPPHTVWLLWYQNIFGEGVLIGHARAHG